MSLYVFGHPRSGNHYLAALMRENLLGPLTQKKLSGKASIHRWPPPFSGEPLGKLFADEGDENRFAYIWRNWDDVAASNVAKEQGRRMAGHVTVQSFSSTPWNVLVAEGSISKALLNRWVMEGQRHMTPFESWEAHVTGWLDFAERRTDVYVVRYEDLRNHFHDTLSDLACWLGDERESFVNVTAKADPAGVRPGGYRGH